MPRSTKSCSAPPQNRQASRAALTAETGAAVKATSAAPPSARSTEDTVGKSSVMLPREGTTSSRQRNALFHRLFRCLGDFALDARRRRPSFPLPAGLRHSLLAIPSIAGRDPVMPSPEQPTVASWPPPWRRDEPPAARWSRTRWRGSPIPAGEGRRCFLKVYADSARARRPMRRTCLRAAGYVASPLAGLAGLDQGSVRRRRRAHAGRVEGARRPAAGDARRADRRAAARRRRCDRSAAPT